MGSARAAPPLASPAAPGDRAQRSVLSEASTVRRPSWQASRASAADLGRPDNRLFSDVPGTQRARPSVMSQWMSRSHQAKGNTAATLRQRALSFLVTFVNAFNTVRHGGPRRLRQKLSASSHEERILRSNLPPASFCEKFGSIFQLF